VSGAAEALSSKSRRDEQARSRHRHSSDGGATLSSPLGAFVKLIGPFQTRPGPVTDATRIHARMTSVQTDLQREVAALLVEALNLDVAAESIDPEAPLYGEGLGLDSIDILEVALVVSQRYGFQLRSDDEDNIRIFTSLASLSEHIAAHRVG
jgi:acyl carrier protein